MNRWRHKIFFAVLMVISESALAATSAMTLTVPDEIESTSGISTGLSNGGAAAFSGISSVRSNPAMLALEKSYSVSGSYHWPAIGTDFYQMGVIDSKTSEVAAGVSLVKPSESYENMLANSEVGDTELMLPLKMRMALGIGYMLSRMAVGVSGQVIEGFRLESTETGQEIKKVRGNTVGLGIAGLFSPNIRFSLSAENLANRQVAFIAPRFIRGGIAYLAETGSVTMHLDYINRAALVSGENPNETERRALGLVAVNWSASDAAQSEQQVIGSFTAKAYDLLRIVGSYGAVFETKRQMFAGGIALVNKNWTMSYMAMRPDTLLASAHQAVSLELSISL